MVWQEDNYGGQFRAWRGKAPLRQVAGGNKNEGNTAGLNRLLKINYGGLKFNCDTLVPELLGLWLAVKGLDDLRP